MVATTGRGESPQSTDNTFWAACGRCLLLGHSQQRQAAAARASVRPVRLADQPVNSAPVQSAETAAGRPTGDNHQSPPSCLPPPSSPPPICTRRR